MEVCAGEMGSKMEVRPATMCGLEVTGAENVSLGANWKFEIIRGTAQLEWFGDKTVLWTCTEEG